jgi:hypothetical protein
MKGSTHIQERLDRVVANTEWRMKFPLVHVKNGDPFHSDHRPVVVQTERFQEPASGGGPKAFRFEVSWLQEVDCRKIIEEAWGCALILRVVSRRDSGVWRLICRTRVLMS